MVCTAAVYRTQLWQQAVNVFTCAENFIMRAYGDLLAVGFSLQWTLEELQFLGPVSTWSASLDYSCNSDYIIRKKNTITYFWKNPPESPNTAQESQCILGSRTTRLIDTEKTPK